MKNILIYTSPDRKFPTEDEILAKIQIDNSLSLGWKIEDILFYTNFSFQYRSVKSIIVPDLYCFDKTANKILVIDYLLRNNLLKNELYFYHDFDAYQNNVITEEELELTGFDLGLTHYTYKNEWNCGCFFFRSSCHDIIQFLIEKMNGRRRTRPDEKWLTHMTTWNLIDKNRYKKMNPTYNISMMSVGYTTARAKKPLKILHFHPTGRDHFVSEPLVKTFIHRGLVVGRLRKIFAKYGIK